jgi:WD40-like Beta Propeller Repeat
MVARRLRLGTLAWLCAAGVCVFAGVSAQAAVIYGYLPEVSKTLSEGVPASSGVPVTGPLSGLGSMKVDSGHLWVAEHIEGTDTFRVDEFDAATGGFLSQLPQVSGFEGLGFSVAVGHGTVYVVAGQVPGGEGGLAVFSEAGALQATWTGANTPTGPFGHTAVSDVAVDRSVSGLASGSVYVADEHQAVVDVFRPEGVGKEPPVSEPSSEHVAQLTGTCPVEGTTCEPSEVIPFSHPSRVTVDDSTGDLLVLDRIQEEVEEKVVGRDVVDVFEPEVLGGYVFVRQITGTPAGPFGGVQNIAVDGTSGEVYVADSFSPGFVDQFSATGVFLGRITGESTPGGDLRSPLSIAIDPVSHHVFVGDHRQSGVPPQPAVIDVFGPGLTVPDVTTGTATGVTPYSATLTGVVKLDKEGEATCHFVWGTTKELGQITPCSAPVTEEESAVQATLSQATGSQLEADTTYFYRLQATNKNGFNPGEPAQDQQFTTSGPGIHEEAVSNVAATSVTFTARINPHNAPTTSYFQYGTSSAYGTNVPVAPGPPLGAGEGDVEATPQHVQGLVAGTVYHYRVVAVSEPSPGRFEEFDGPDQTFTTQSSGGAFALPDGRSWELVTPAEKKGALFNGILEGLIQASSNGDAIADLASHPTEAEPQGYSDRVSVLSTRGADGWSSQVIAPPHNEGTGASIGNGVEYRFFSEDLSYGIVQPFGNFTPLSPEASESTAYLRTDYLNGDVGVQCHSSCFTPLVTTANTPPGIAFGEEPNGRCEIFICGPFFVGASPDLSHVIIRSPVSLTAGSGGGLYEWAGGKLAFIGRGTLGVYKNPAVSARHAVSSDGSRVIFTGESEGLKGLLTRDMVKGKTVLIAGGGEFMMASSDGSRIFFLGDEHLTPESSASGLDLYEYDLNAPFGSRLTDLTVDKHANEVANATQVVGASEDGSYVYFTASGALAPGARHGECGGNAPPPGDTETCNLYVHHAGATRLVAALSAEDYPDWDVLSQLPVRVSPNGRWLAFTSNRSLTGYDTRDAVSGRPDEEVYLYDTNGDKLVCASCNPTGARPVGVEYKKINLAGADRVWKPDTWIAANVPPWTRLSLGEALYQSRYLSDGGRLFFNSNDALVSQDVNGTEDVYEYEPVGIPENSAGECSSGSVTFSARSGGCVDLVSSGASAEESAFLDASTTGGDVFFLTTAKLVSQDFDTALDVYDAHECAIQAPCFARAPVSPPACSTSDSCKAAPSPQPPVFGSPSSSTFSGAGNVIASAVAPGVRPRSLTRTQKLMRALRACRKKRSHGQQTVCERKARKRYEAKRSRKANANRSRG